MIYNGYEYVKSKGITRRRNLVKNNIKKKNCWRKVCTHKDCLSISKGKSGKCIKHQKGNRCNMLNCKKLKIDDMYCSTHISLKDTLSNNTSSNHILNNKNKVLSIAKHLIINNTWIFYDNLEIRNHNKFNSTKCEGLCCSYYKENEKPEGIYCDKEHKFLCKLCFIY